MRGFCRQRFGDLSGALYDLSAYVHESEDPSWGNTELAAIKERTSRPRVNVPQHAVHRPQYRQSYASREALSDCISMQIAVTSRRSPLITYIVVSICTRCGIENYPRSAASALPSGPGIPGRRPVALGAREE